MGFQKRIQPQYDARHLPLLNNALTGFNGAGGAGRASEHWKGENMNTHRPLPFRLA